MFKSALLLLLAQSTTGFTTPPLSPSLTKIPSLNMNLRDMASYPDDMKMMENYAEFDRNGAFSGNRGYNNAYGGRNYYGSDGSYYSNNNGRYGRGDYYNDGQMVRGYNNSGRRDREISFSASRGYNGSYNPNGRGYDGIERYGYGRGQRMSNAYNGYYNNAGGGMRRMDSYNGGGNGYSRSQYDFRRNGDRSGYAYADSMDGSYNRGRMGYRQSGIREDRPVQGFSYSSRVREYGDRNYRGDYGRNYRGDMRGMRDDMGYYDPRMDGMGYGGYYDDYDRDFEYDRYDRRGRDERMGYGYGRSQY